MTSNKTEIEEKILEEAKKECLEDNRIRKAISLTFAECQKCKIKKAILLHNAECQKQNSDFVKEVIDILGKLPESCDTIRAFYQIKELAKEFGIKQVGEEFKEDYDEAIKKGKPIIK